MAKEKLKLTKSQYMQMQGLSLPEKLDLLHDWKKNGEISQSQFNFFSNLWISRMSKKMIGEAVLMRKTVGEDQTSHKKSILECSAERFVNQLQSRLNAYLANRQNPCILTDKDIDEVRKYFDKPLPRSIKNRLLVLGLRYPDKRLNHLCEITVKEQKRHPFFMDAPFWIMLWEDGNLVPMDAVRLMLKKQGENYVIDPIFDKSLISILIPMIEIQRDKEITRLKWAQSLDGAEREHEVTRKTRRLNAFNILLNAAEEYIKA